LAIENNINQLHFMEPSNKDYEEPTITVVELQQQESMLAGSDLMDSSRNDYGTAIELEWGI